MLEYFEECRTTRYWEKVHSGDENSEVKYVYGVLFLFVDNRFLYKKFVFCSVEEFNQMLDKCRYGCDEFHYYFLMIPTRKSEIMFDALSQPTSNWMGECRRWRCFLFEGCAKICNNTQFTRQFYWQVLDVWIFWRYVDRLDIDIL